MNLVEVSRNLSAAMAPLRFAAPVTHVYNPLDYAFESHKLYLDKYGRGTRDYLLLGMNPGPWGMAQTGVPFGDVAMVRDWLEVKAPVREPRHPHPKRPVQGFDCERSEVSGTRLWTWARDTFETPQRFFSRFFVVNYCPLAFLETTGRNRTPDRLKAPERRALFDPCDVALQRVVAALSPKMVIGVGKFAETRATQALEGSDVKIGRIPHPSPANPMANAGWSAMATKAFEQLGVSF